MPGEEFPRCAAYNLLTAMESVRKGDTTQVFPFRLPDSLSVSIFGWSNEILVPFDQGRPLISVWNSWCTLKCWIEMVDVRRV